jgi:hypothetical protein
MTTPASHFPARNQLLALACATALAAALPGSAAASPATPGAPPSDKAALAWAYCGEAEVWVQPVAGSGSPL